MEIMEVERPLKILVGLPLTDEVNRRNELGNYSRKQYINRKSELNNDVLRKYITASKDNNDAVFMASNEINGKDDLLYGITELIQQSKAKNVKIVFTGEAIQPMFAGEKAAAISIGNYNAEDITRICKTLMKMFPLDKLTIRLKAGKTASIDRDRDDSLSNTQRSLYRSSFEDRQVKNLEFEIKDLDPKFLESISEKIAYDLKQYKDERKLKTELAVKGYPEDLLIMSSGRNGPVVHSNLDQEQINLLKSATDILSKEVREQNLSSEEIRNKRNKIYSNAIQNANQGFIHKCTFSDSNSRGR